MGWWIVATALSAWSSPPAVPQGADGSRAGPSFSCARASGVVETTICANPALSAADREMAALYAVDQVSAFGSGPSNEQAAQRKALLDIRRCAAPPPRQTVVQCLQTRYDGRNNELAMAALMRSPALALPVIRRTDLIFAPIAEAIQLWASEPEGTDWASAARAGKRAHIAALLKPAMTDLQTKPDQSFGREILSDPSGGGVAVRRVEDLFVSDRHFAAFLNVLGPYIADDVPHGERVVPCAAIVHHRALLAATGSVFGSTMDNFVLQNDCDDMLPPTPLLASLTTKLTKSWPKCDGTIRFAAYRTYGTSVDAARLGFTRPDGGTASRRRGVAAGDIVAARNELAGYYGRYLGKSPAAAGRMAADAVGDIVADAHSCG